MNVTKYNVLGWIMLAAPILLLAFISQGWAGIFAVLCITAGAAWIVFSLYFALWPWS